MKKLVLITLIISLLAVSAIAALTTITIENPSNNTYIRGTYVIKAVLGGSESADSVSFWNSTNGLTWSLIGTNSTAGGTFYMPWDTTGTNMVDVRISANATNSTANVSSFNSGIVVDNTAPPITSVANASVLEHNATITWLTNENSNSTVKYGTTTALGASAGTNFNVSSHSVQVNALSENTTYYYNVSSCDLAGNCNETGPYSFTTLSLVPSITAVTASPISSTFAVITWTTSEDANTTVNYGLTTALGTYAYNSTNATSHSVNVTGLTNGTLYYYNVTSCDSIGNCNTNGTNSLTTLVDTTKPMISDVLINGSTTLAVYINATVNVTASVADNTNVSFAWVQFQFADGTNESRNMTKISGTGSLADPAKYSLIYSATKSGKHNVTVYGQDMYGNVNSNNTNLSVYGYFTLTTNVTTPIKNFSTGANYVYKVTITNDNNITENYSVNTTITNVSGWTVSQSVSNATLASLASYDVLITVAVPANASNTVAVRTTVNSTSNYSSYKEMSFEMPTIVITLPTLIYVLNDSNKTNTLYYWYNSTNTTYWKGMNVTSIGPYYSEVDGNITNNVSVNCGLYKNTTRVYAGTMNITSGVCNISLSSVTPGAYNFTVNATHLTRGYKGQNYTAVYVPQNLSISTNAVTAVKGGSFTLTGTAKYDNATAAPFVVLQANYASMGCNGTSDYTGAFSVACTAPSATGPFTLDLSAYGVWNTTNKTSTTLTVNEYSQNQSTPEEYMTMTLSASAITLDSAKTFTVTLFNNRSSTQTYAITISQGDYKRFGVKYNSSLTVSSGQSKQTTVTLTPIANAKPGTYTLTVSVPQESVSKTLSVTVPEPSYANNSLTTTRYIEERVDNTSATVIISLKNGKNETIVAEVTETIPKDFASNASDVTFSPEPTEIINADPVVKWVVALEAGETKEIRYTANKMASNVTFAEPFVETNEVITGGETTAGNDSSKITLIIIIVIVTAFAAIIILYKDEIFKGRGVKIIKPANILKKKEEQFESPYPGRKLDSFGETQNVDKLGTMPAKPTETPEKKTSKAVDFSKLG